MVIIYMKRGNKKTWLPNESLFGLKYPDYYWPETWISVDPENYWNN